MKNYSCTVKHQWEADFLNNWAKARNWGKETVWKVGRHYEKFFAGVNPTDGRYYYGVVGDASFLHNNSESISFAEMVAFLEKEHPKEYTLELNSELSVLVDKKKIVLRFGDDDYHKIDHGLFEQIVNFWQENKS
jgi:hypothetical protein